MKRVYVPSETTQAALVNSIARKAWRTGEPLDAQFRICRIATFTDPATGLEMKAFVESNWFITKIWDPSIDPAPVISLEVRADDQL